MEFPVGDSELLLPRILGYVRRLIVRAFDAVGLGDLLDTDAPWPENSGLGNQFDNHHQQQERPLFRSTPAMVIQEAIPTMQYEELVAAESRQHVGGSCMVCLRDFEGAEDVRPLRNCRHVFHRGCLDRWLEYHHPTCPLCRAPLVTEEAIGSDLPDSYYDDDFSLPFP